MTREEGDLASEVRQVSLLVLAIGAVVLQVVNCPGRHLPNLSSIGIFDLLLRRKHETVYEELAFFLRERLPWIEALQDLFPRELLLLDMLFHFLVFRGLHYVERGPVVVELFLLLLLRLFFIILLGRNTQAK